MSQILLQPSDPVEIFDGDLDPLVQDLRGRGYDVEVTERLRVGYGVTWWEVFHFVVLETAEEVREHIVEAVVAAFVLWARQRFKKKDGRAERAPKHATIYGPDGKRILKEVTVKRDEEPEITAPSSE